MKDIKIKSVTIPQGTTIHKTLRDGNQSCFGIAVVFELEDGRKIPSLVTSKRKKDLLGNVATKNGHAAKGNLSACFRDDSTLWGTSTKYDISEK
jgi:hypothetical protein